MCTSQSEDVSFMARQPLVGQGLLSVEGSRRHSDTPHSVGLLWTTDQPDEEPLPDNPRHSQEIYIHAASGIRTRSPSNQEAADSRLARLGQWDWQ
jgi:hypothetical protein